MLHSWHTQVSLWCGIFGLSHLCLLLQNTFFYTSKHRWLCAQKIYKLRQTKLSQFVYFSLILREREETNTKYSAPSLVLVTPKPGPCYTEQRLHTATQQPSSSLLQTSQAKKYIRDQGGG